MLGDLGDQGDGAVEAAQHLVGVPSARPGVVGDLVVAHEVGVDGGAPGEDVAEDGRDDHVPLDDRREGPDEGVEAAPAQAGLSRRILARVAWPISRKTSAT
ncbi:hypothetical protein ACFQ2B_05885 [Streptomyces stramineus]